MLFLVHISTPQMYVLALLEGTLQACTQTCKAWSCTVQGVVIIGITEMSCKCLQILQNRGQKIGRPARESLYQVGTRKVVYICLALDTQKLRSLNQRKSSSLHLPFPSRWYTQLWPLHLVPLYSEPQLAMGSTEKPRGKKNPIKQFFSFLNPDHCAAAKAALPCNWRGKAEAGIPPADTAPKLWSEQPWCEFAGFRLPEVSLPTGSRKLNASLVSR